MQNGVMYNGNFVDMMLKYIMEHGWEGISLIALFNFYIYLSIDKFKDLFKWLNDKIAEHGKIYLEYFWKIITTYVKTYYEYLWKKITEYAKKYFEEKYNWVKEKLKTFIDKYTNKKQPTKDNNVVNIVDDKKETSKITNNVTISLNHANKTDLMALGNFLLKNKQHMNIHNYHRNLSDKYKTTETYEVPFVMMFSNNILNNKELKTEENITITINQNINYSLVCESDGKVEILKDVKIKSTIGEICSVSHSGFRDMAKMCYISHADQTPSFKYKEKEGEPDSICHGNFTGILLYIYYTKNSALFTNFYNFVCNKGTFDFAGKKYKMEPSYIMRVTLKTPEDIATFWTALVEYVDKKMIPCFSESSTKDIKQWIERSEFLFNTVSSSTVLNIDFESASMTKDTLSNYSKRFMYDLIADYYHQSHDNIGNKISVYQLNIKYNVEKQKKENPEYVKWFSKYGKKEEEDKKKEEEKKKEEDKKKDDEKKDGEKKDGDKKDGAKDNDKKDDDKKDDDKNDDKESPYQKNSRYKNPNKHAKDEEEEVNEYGYPVYKYPKYPAYSAYNYVPPEPAKIIEVDVNVPVAETILVKSDKKPLQHLYLQKYYKTLLENYLKNFKNNRELYEKMGIPYKGGIILSGSPGCGKSSAILAIATYLNKDIYYLDLGKIKTNKELKISIDFVKTSSHNGGVIIFEDIDCMTDIVKCRSGKLGYNLSLVSNNTYTAMPTIENTLSNISVEPSITKTINTQNDDLSLSFLLNILDGTMAPENIIFIMTTNHREILDPALIRPGRMDISIDIKKCDTYQLQQIYHDLYNRHLKQQYVDRFREFDFITAEVILHLFHNVYNVDIDDEQLLEKFLKPQSL